MEQQINKEEQFDIVWLLKYIYSKRKFIFTFIGGMLLLCIIIYMVRPKKYVATASILPVEEDESLLSGMGSLSSLASMAGVNLSNFSKSTTIITAELYPKVAESVPFLSYMIDVPLPWKEPTDTTMTFWEHTNADTIPTIGKTIFNYTIGLPHTISQSLQEKSVIAPTDDAKLPYMQIDIKRMMVMETMKNMIKVENDPQYKIIEISVEAGSPEQASILVSALIEKLQETVTEHKTRRANAILKFTEDRYEEANADYEEIYKRFSHYKDQHRDMIEERIGSEYQRLSDQYDLSRSILNTLASQLEQSRLAVMQNTPVFSVVDPVVLPQKKDSPKLLLHIVSGILLGTVLSIGWLLLQLGYWQVFDEEKFRAIKEKIQK